MNITRRRVFPGRSHLNAQYSHPDSHRPLGMHYLFLSALTYVGCTTVPRGSSRHRHHSKRSPTLSLRADPLDVASTRSMHKRRRAGHARLSSVAPPHSVGPSHSFLNLEKVCTIMVCITQDLF